MIKVEHLNFIYQQGMPTQRQALFDISLEIPTGDLVALIGHTGSGKSTLIQHFNALTKPTSGKIYIDGVDITDKGVKKTDIRRKVGLVFQYPEHQLFEETVYKDISYGPKNLGLSDEEIKDRVYHSASLVGIDEKYFEFSPFDLSGGQKRRVAIAGVLAMSPTVLILDEPVAGLDPKGREGILSMIENLHEIHPEMTIIFVSHSMEDVAKIAKHIIVMNNGTIAMQGDVANVFSREKELVEMGLSVPQITKLANRLRDLGYSIPDQIYTLKYGAKIISKLIKGE